MSDNDKIKLFSSLPPDVAADVIFEVSEYTRNLLLEKLPSRKLASIIRRLESDEAADLLEYISKEKKRKILALLPKEKAKAIMHVLKYQPETAGGIMKTEMITCEEGDKVKDIIARIRKSPVEKFAVIYVTDKNGKLVGFIPLRTLLRADPRKKAREIMNPDVVYVNADADQEEVIRLFRKHSFFSLPVVDNKKRLVGVITADDVIDVVEEEITEDMYLAAGLGEDEDVFDPPKKVWPQRTIWLVVNLFTAFIAAATVALFEGTIQKVVLLAVFMPIVAGMGGNAGTQAMTVVIRGLALGRINFSDVWRVVVKELIVGIIAGIITGSVASAIAYLWKGNQLIGFVIFLGMIITLAIANISGVLIPIILKRLGFDPAVSSGIFLTTITDVVGYATFLGLATLLMG